MHTAVHRTGAGNRSYSAVNGFANRAPASHARRYLSLLSPGRARVSDTVDGRRSSVYGGVYGGVYPAVCTRRCYCPVLLSGVTARVYSPGAVLLGCRTARVGIPLVLILPVLILPVWYAHAVYMRGVHVSRGVLAVLTSGVDGHLTYGMSTELYLIYFR